MQIQDYWALTTSYRIVVPDDQSLHPMDRGDRSGLVASFCLRLIKPRGRMMKKREFA